MTDEEGDVGGDDDEEEDGNDEAIDREGAGGRVYPCAVE